MTEHSAAAPVLRFVDDRAVRDLEQLATRARRVADTGMRLHVVPAAGADRDRVLDGVQDALHQLGVEHATVQIEPPGHIGHETVCEI